MSKSPSRSAHAGGLLTIQRVAPAEQGRIALTSTGVDADGRLDGLHGGADGLSPALAWSRVLEAQTYVLVVEDPDAPGERPFLHWLVWNLPGDLEALPQGIAEGHKPSPLNGAVQGRNSAGAFGYRGASPPEGAGAHRYHFQLFALSGRIDHLKPESAGLDEIVDALKGMTIASGELVALFETPDPLDAAPREPRSFEGREDAGEGRGGLDADDVDRHAPHGPDGEVLRS